MNPVLDMTLSFEARGVVAYLLVAGHTTMTVQQVRALGIGRDASYRVCGELEYRGFFRKSGKGVYTFLILGSSPGELPNSRNFLNSGIQEVATTIHRSSDLRHVVETSQNPEVRKFDGETTGDALSGSPETPTPVASPPPPRRERRENPPEAKALYPAVFELCKSGQKGKKSIACRNLARDLWAEFEATPEQVAAFWDWFRRFSRPAQQAARESRPVNAPMPSQVYGDWREFLVWWNARQAEAARREEAERRRREQPEPQPVGDAREFNPFRNRFSKPVMVATD